MNHVISAALPADLCARSIAVRPRGYAAQCVTAWASCGQRAMRRACRCPFSGRLRPVHLLFCCKTIWLELKRNNRIQTTVAATHSCQGEGCDESMLRDFSLSRVLQQYPSKSRRKRLKEFRLLLTQSRHSTLPHQSLPQAHYLAAETIISTKVSGVSSTPTTARAGGWSVSIHAIQASFISSFSACSEM